MVNVACLGAGYFSQFHLAGWGKIDTAQIVGVADSDVERAEATGHPAFSSLKELLHVTRPDVLDIIVPPIAHAEAIQEALKYPLRAIICQKPFCRSIDEARAMAMNAQKAGIPLIVHENFRFQPWYRSVRRQIDAGAIGRPLQATFRLRPGDGQGPKAYLARQPYFQTMERFLVHETLVHWIDTFRFLFGPVQSVYSELRRINPVIAGEDAGFLLMTHDDDVRVMVDANRHLDHDAADTRCTMGEALIEGDHGALDLLGDGSVWHRPFGTRDRVQVLPPDQSNTFGGDCTRLLQAHVIDGLASGVFENLAADYLSVLAVEEAAYQSSATGRKITLPRS